MLLSCFSSEAEKKPATFNKRRKELGDKRKKVQEGYGPISCSPRLIISFPTKISEIWNLGLCQIRPSLEWWSSLNLWHFICSRNSVEQHRARYCGKTITKVPRLYIRIISKSWDAHIINHSHHIEDIARSESIKGDLGKWQVRDAESHKCPLLGFPPHSRWRDRLLHHNADGDHLEDRDWGVCVAKSKKTKWEETPIKDFIIHQVEF